MIVVKTSKHCMMNMGMENSRAVCISFHIAEHALKYPFKKQTS